MANTPKISVLLPVYNAERYVAAAIESIFVQSFRDWELIIIDDGSTDRSLDVLRRFASADQRIRVFSRANTGYVVALNEGLSHARGEFIARMDADDISLPERFRAQVAYLESYPEYVAVGTAFRYIDHHGVQIGVSQAESDVTELRRRLLTHGGMVIAHPTAMIRREALERINGYRPEFLPAEDWDLWLRLDEIGALSNVPEVHFEYRLHLSSITNTHRPIQIRQAYRAIADAYTRRGLTSAPPTAPEISGTPELALRHWYGMAREFGAKSAARRFAIQLIRHDPLKRSYWSMLADATVDQNSARALRSVYRRVRRPFGAKQTQPLPSVPRNGAGRPRIAFVSSSDGFGGDVRYWLGLLQSFTFRTSLDCHIILWNSAAHQEIKRELDRISIPSYTLDRVWERPLGIRRRIAAKARRTFTDRASDPLYTALRKIGADLVWFNFGGMEYPPLRPTMEKCLAAGMPYWYVCHNVPNGYLFANSWHRDIISPLIKGAACFAANSQTGMRDIERALASNLANKLVFHVTKSREFMAAANQVAVESPVRTNGSARFVHLGSLTPQFKGQHILLEALADEVWKSRDWHLSFYGSGSDFDYLTQLIQYFGLGRRVSVVGETHQVLDTLSNSDLFVFPSVSEGKGFALVEAMACGRPAVGTAIGGIPELVIDGVTGWLARAASVEEIGLAMERAWIDRPNWKDFGKRAREHVTEEFCHNATISMLLNRIYKDLGREWISSGEHIH